MRLEHKVPSGRSSFDFQDSKPTLAQSHRLVMC